MWFFSTPLTILGTVCRNLKHSRNAVQKALRACEISKSQRDVVRVSFVFSASVESFAKFSQSPAFHAREIALPFTAPPCGNMRDSRENRKTSRPETRIITFVRRSITRSHTGGITNFAITPRHLSQDSFEPRLVSRRDTTPRTFCATARYLLDSSLPAGSPLFSSLFTECDFPLAKP